ncbi:MAG TPA: hypothetical protein VGL77_06345 [Armatimonadota bacterium]|jgi:hypothetical protein
MDENFSAKLKKTAEEVVLRVGEAAQQAGERLGEMRDHQRLTQQIRTLQQEKEQCRQSMADLVIRMFDQQAFADALLKPEYQRIKAIEAEISCLEQERMAIGQVGESACTCEVTTKE